MSNPVKQNWYQCSGSCSGGPRNKIFSHGFGSRYQFPLPTVKNAPVPSNANYSQQNVAWMIEFFGQMLGTSADALQFKYENNTPNDTTDDITVVHPGGSYLPQASNCKPKSDAMRKYESRAKSSQSLKTYMNNSPAKIKYFNNSCSEQI